MTMQPLLAGFPQRKIQTRLVVSYLAFAGITVAAVIYFAYAQASQALQHAGEDRLTAVVKLKRDGISQWVTEQQLDTEFLANLPEIQSLAGQVFSPDGSLQARARAHRELSRRLQETVRHSTDLQAIQVIDLNGQVVVSTLPDLEGVSQAEQPFFTQGLSQTFSQPFYHSDLLGSRTLTVAAPLFDNFRKPAGVLALHFHLKPVDHFIQTGDATATYLVDSNGDLLSDDLQGTPLRSPAVELAFQGKPDSLVYVNHKGMEVIGRAVRLNDQNVALLVEIDRETVLQPARDLAVNVGIVGIQIVIILLVVVILMTERFTASLRALNETVARISRGQWDALAPIMMDDEVGELARALNSMTKKLRQTFIGLQSELNERKQVESDLLQFRTVMDESNDAIFLIDPETGRCIDFNTSAYEILGYSREELERLAVIDIAEYVTSLADWHARVDLIHETGSLVFETMYRRKDYTTFPVEISARLLYYGGRTLLLFVARDSTQRKHSEQELRESEERFRKVFQSSPVAISITALEDGRLLDANYAYWDMTGYVAEEALGRTAKELNLWEDIRTRAEFVEDLKRKGSLFNPDDHFYHTDGTLKYVISFHELIQIGNEDCVLSMFYDMSVQKQTMQALQQSEARTRALVDAFPDMIMELSLEGVIVNVVPPKGFETEMPAGHFIGKRMEELFDPAVAGQMSLAMQQVIADNQIEVFELEILMAGKVHIMEARLTASASDTVLVMVRDFTQRRWAEKEREKLISELENKNAELERFTYTVSHDLKSPLFTIRGFLGYLEKDALSGNYERLKGDIQRITNATDKMQSLLNELLELSRIGRLKNESSYIKFNDILSEALELVHGRITERGIVIRAQEDLPQVYGDRPRLVEVLQNLLDNAAKFMGAQKQPCIEIGQAGNEDDKPVFYVRDNGLGIAPEHHDRVFGLFNKLDPQTDGTGVGLALVRRILEVHGCRIWIESAEGQGSTFFFTLPTQPHPDSVI